MKHKGKTIDIYTTLQQLQHCILQHVLYPSGRLIKQLTTCAVLYFTVYDGVFYTTGPFLQ